MDIARALVDGEPDRDAVARDAAAFGLALELADEPAAVEVWPEHWSALQTAIAMSTQMTVGMGGVVGYRYEALPVVWDLLSVSADERPETFDAFRVIESEVLRAVRERQERDRG